MLILNVEVYKLLCYNKTNMYTKKKQNKKQSSQKKSGICPVLPHYLNPCVRIAKAQITVLSGTELLKVNQRKDGFSSCLCTLNVGEYSGRVGNQRGNLFSVPNGFHTSITPRIQENTSFLLFLMNKSIDGPEKIILGKK